MQALKLILLLVSALSLSAADRITLTITVTNLPVDGNTLVVNASTRTARTNVASASTEFLIGASIGATATNLWNHIIRNAFSGPLAPAFSSTNVITLRGQVSQALTASITGTWASLSYSTQTVATASVVRVPASSEPTQSTATNIISQLVSDISTYSTNSIGETATALANFVSETQTQTFGNKTLTNSILSGGSTTNAAIGASTLFASGAINFTGGGLTTNIGAGVGQLWAVSNAVFYSQIILTNTAPVIKIHDSDAPLDEKSWFIRGLGGNLTIETQADDGTGGSTSFELVRNGDSVSAVNMLTAATVQLGHPAIYGNLSIIRANHTALANGNNSGVNFGTTTYVKVKAGPTAAFTIAGITGGADGKYYIISNRTGQNMTIANDSGIDATPGNRIYTGTGGDRTTTGDGTVIVIYDSEDSRWQVLSFDS